MSSATAGMNAARQRHLAAASELLMVSSPAVSAHLRSSELALHDDQDLSSSATPYEICTACGSVLLLGWSSRIAGSTLPSRGSQKAKRRAPRRSQSGRQQCLRCNAVSAMQANMPTKARKPDNMTTKITAPAVQASTPLPKPPSLDTQPATESLAVPSNAGSRKARSKKSSLQALLAGQQSSNSKAGSTKPGYDLKDFMKT
jgi:hypothetical protein